MVSVATGPEKEPANLLARINDNLGDAERLRLSVAPRKPKLPTPIENKKLDVVGKKPAVRPATRDGHQFFYERPNDVNMLGRNADELAFAQVGAPMPA